MAGHLVPGDECHAQPLEEDAHHPEGIERGLRPVVEEADVDEDQGKQQGQDAADRAVARAGPGDHDGVALEIHRQPLGLLRQGVVIDRDLALAQQLADRLVQVLGVARDHAVRALLQGGLAEVAGVGLPLLPPVLLRPRGVEVDRPVLVVVDQVDRVDRVAGVLGPDPAAAAQHAAVGVEGLPPLPAPLQAPLRHRDEILVDRDLLAPQEGVEPEQEQAGPDGREDQHQQGLRRPLLGREVAEQADKGRAAPDQREDHHESAQKAPPRPGQGGGQAVEGELDPVGDEVAGHR